MSDQIAEKIDLIRNNQRGKILGEIKDIKEMTQYFSESSDIKGLISMNNYFIKDGKLVELTNVWSSLITKNSDILTQNNGMLAASEFSYITNENGVVVADSRIGNTDNIKEYVGKKLSENEYSKVLNEEVHIYNGKPYVLFNSKINAEGAEEDGPTGYYVMAMSLDIFYSDSLQSLTSISSFKLLNSNGYILSSSDKSLMGNQIDDSWYETQINSSQESAVRDLENRKQYFDQISNQYGIYMAIDVPLNVINGPVNNIRNIILFISIVGILILFLANYFLLSWQLKPLKMLIRAFDNLAAGKLTDDVMLIETAKKEDEIGKLSKSFNNMIREFKDIISEINNASDEVEESSNYMREVSNEVGNVSTQIAKSINDVAVGADNQAESVDTINQQIKTLAEDIEKLKNSNQEVEKLADEMENAATDGKSEIDKVSNQMAKIRNAIEEVAAGISNLETISNEIGEILNIINNIAEQTNLLALNAAIEAARAGEAGRGFSVVADEIRELAEESVNSAEEIRKLVEDVKVETKTASSRMDDGIDEIQNGENVVSSAEDSFGDIENKIKNAATGIESSLKIVEDVDSYTEKIVHEVGEIASISGETSANTEEVAAASQEQNASIEEITSLADSLAEMSANLNQSVKRFDLNS
jgi:methyl-accepting chemotaxis protein